MSTTTAQGTIWVCDDCMILDANGDMPDDPREGEPAPWALWTNEEMTMGTLEHECDYPEDWQNGNCDCERREFSWSSCEGCGSTLGGARNAFTWWQ